MTFMTVDDKRFGLKIPGCAQIVKVNETRESKMDFKSDESYMASRLSNLGLNIELAPSILNMIYIAPIFGISTSRKKDSCVQSTKTTKLSLTEYRMLKITIADLKSEGIQFTNDFSSAVKELPDRYTYEERNKDEFVKFFKRFGHFVVTSAFVGGAVEVKTCRASVERSEHDEKSLGGSAGANVYGIVGFKVSGKNQSSTESAKTDVLDVAETRWQGGRSDLHDKSTLQSEEKLLMWKASLAKNPILLTTQMRLEPISSVVAIIDKTKRDACYQALHGLFGDIDLSPVSSLQDQRALKAKMEMEEERRRKKSNERTGSIKQPDTKKWWESIVEFFNDVYRYFQCVFD